MAAAFVQSKHTVASFDGQATIAVAFTTNVVAGNLITGFLTWDGDIALGTPGVTDSQGNTYTVQTPLDNGTESHAVAFHTIAGSSGACTVTGTLASAASRKGIVVHEASGDTLTLEQYRGKVQSNPGTGANAVTSDPVTTVANGQYIFAATADPGYSTGKTEGTGFTAREEDASSSFLMSEDQVQATAGSIAGTFTIDGFAVTMTAIMTFKETGGGGGISIPVVQHHRQRNC